MNDITNVLKEAKLLIDTKREWCQGNMEVNYWDKDGFHYKRCLVSAICKASNNPMSHINILRDPLLADIFKYLTKFIPQKDDEDNEDAEDKKDEKVSDIQLLIRFNDNGETEYNDVRDLLDTAISNAKVL